jgi:F-type H+-transporting ATPase subunit delta
MSQSRIAHRYAEALITAAGEEKILDEVMKYVLALQSLIAASQEFRLLLHSPVIKQEKKSIIFKELFKEKITPLMLNFLLLLAEKGRENALLEIVEEYFKLNDERLGVVKVHLTSAVELAKKQNDVLAAYFENSTHKKIKILAGIDKNLIGGFMARIGDTVFDGSVRRQLEVLRQRLIEQGAVV